MPFIVIRVRNRLGSCRLDWFEGITIEPISLEETRLSGEVPDLSAIYGIIVSLRSQGLTLISVDLTEQGEIINGLSRES